MRGRGGGTFVSRRRRWPRAGVDLAPGHWREVLDYRIAVEVGRRARRRARRPDDSRAARHVETMRDAARDFTVYRRADVFFHLGLAEAAQSARLLAAMTEVQGR